MKNQFSLCCQSNHSSILSVIHTPILLLSIGLTSCNWTSFMDSPSSDRQYLSAARSCLDKGDLTCAQENYENLSDEFTDTKYSELAFSKLAKTNADLKSFLKAFGSGSGTNIIALSESFRDNAGATTRAEVFSAYKDASSVTTVDLRGFVRFVATASLLSEVLAEASGQGTLFTSSSFVTTPDSCENVDFTQCLAGLGDSTPCAKPTSSLLLDGGEAIDLDTVTSIEDINLGVFHSIIRKLLVGLSELGLGGDFSGITTMFQEIEDQTGQNIFVTYPSCYRQLIFSKLFSGSRS